MKETVPFDYISRDALGLSGFFFFSFGEGCSLLPLRGELGGDGAASLLRFAAGTGVASNVRNLHAGGKNARR